MMNIRFGEIFKLQYQRKDLRHTDPDSGEMGDAKTFSTTETYLQELFGDTGSAQDREQVQHSFFEQRNYIKTQLDDHFTKAGIFGKLLRHQDTDYFVMNGKTDSLKQYEAILDEVSPNRHTNKDTFIVSQILSRPFVDTLLQERGFFTKADPLTLKYRLSSKTGGTYLDNGKDAITQIKTALSKA